MTIVVSGKNADPNTVAYLAIVSSGMLDLEQLCIEPGHAVWVLYADIICLNYDGNAMDAAIIALMAALKHGKVSESLVSNDAAFYGSCSSPIAQGNVLRRRKHRPRNG